MFIVVENKKLWIKVVDGKPTVSFEFNEQELVLINEGDNWSLQDFYDRLVQFSECSIIELVNRSRVV